MSAPDCQARYQATSQCRAVSSERRGRQLSSCLARLGVEHQIAGLVDSGGRDLIPTCSRRPRRRVGLFGDPLDGLGIVVGGAEVVGCGIARGVRREEMLGEGDVAGEGIEHMLPGADGVGAADVNRLIGEEAADEVGDEAVGGPVAAADDVAGARGGEGNLVRSASPIDREVGTGGRRRRRSRRRPWRRSRGRSRRGDRSQRKVGESRGSRSICRW